MQNSLRVIARGIFMRMTFAAVLAAFLVVAGCGPSQEEKDAQAARERYAAQQEQQREEQARIAEQQREEQARLAAQRAAYRAAIEDVVKQDAALGAVSGGSETRQAQAMRAIDLSRCPSDFAEAYTVHIQAWERAAAIQRDLDRLNSDDNVSETIARSIIADLGGSDAAPIHDAVELNNRLKADHQQAVLIIKESFNDVERVAVSYGATVPR